MSDLETKARERIANLRQEIEMLEGYLKMTEATRVLLDRPVSTVIRPQAMIRPDALRVVTAAEALMGSTESSSVRTRISDNPKPSVLIPAVVEILRENGKPMSRRELHDALSARGLVVRGAEPTKTLGTILWRARDVIGSIEGRGYWPVGDAEPEPVPPDVIDLLG